MAPADPAAGEGAEAKLKQLFTKLNALLKSGDGSLKRTLRLIDPSEHGVLLELILLNCRACSPWMYHTCSSMSAATQNHVPPYQEAPAHA